MAITAAMVKELRERTQAGMMDCKKALNATDGDMDKAIEYLRENGLAKAAKKADRIAAEGLVKEAISADKKTAAIVEVNSETDFVAKNDQFVSFVSEVAEVVLNHDLADVDALLATAWPGEAGKTVGDILTEKIATIGEKLTIRRFAKITTNGTLGSYTHGGGKIVAVVDVDSTADNAATVAKDVAMQVAAVNPEYLATKDVPEEKKEHEKAILIEQAKHEDEAAGKQTKPEILEKKIMGRLNKQLKEICLLEQEYIKDPDFTVAKYVAKELGSEDVVKNFVRFETGEGIEKKEENFAEEVAKQMNS